MNFFRFVFVVGFVFWVVCVAFCALRDFHSVWFVVAELCCFLAWVVYVLRCCVLFCYVGFEFRVFAFGCFLVFGGFLVLIDFAHLFS